MSQLELFDTSDLYEPAFDNPMVIQVGKGPIGTTCAECQHVRQVANGNHIKTTCDLNSGAGVDTRYHACRMYKAVRK